MKINITEQDSITIVSVDSSVLQEHVPIFSNRLNNVINENKKWIIIDMLEAQYLSSTGLTVVLEIKKRANKLGGDVKFVNVNRLIMNLLNITNLIGTLDIYENLEDAIESVKKQM